MQISDELSRAGIVRVSGSMPPKGYRVRLEYYSVRVDNDFVPAFWLKAIFDPSVRAVCKVEGRPNEGAGRFAYTFLDDSVVRVASSVDPKFELEIQVDLDRLRATMRKDDRSDSG